MSLLKDRLRTKLQEEIDSLEDYGKHLEFYWITTGYHELLNLSDPIVVGALKELGAEDVDIAEANMRTWLKSCVDAADCSDEVIEQFEEWYPNEEDWPEEAFELKRLIDAEG